MPGRCSLKRAALVVQSAQRRQFFVLPQLGLVHSAPKPVDQNPRPFVSSPVSQLSVKGG
jgi:hypothetical protein